MVEVDVSNKAMKIGKTTFLAMDKAWRTYKARHNGKEYPVVHLNQTTKKGMYVTVAKFKEMRNRWIAWRESHNMERPNYIWIVHKTPSQAVTVKPTTTVISNPNIYLSPRWIRNLKQATNYFCALSVIEQMIYELYGLVTDQYKLAETAGTTQAGTGHSGMEKSMEVTVLGLGHKCDLTYQTFSGLGTTSLARWRKLGEMVADINIGVGIHCLYRLKWGHYMYPVYINLETKIVGFVDTLNEEEVLYVPFATAETWIAQTTGGQPSVIKATKIY